MGEILMCRIAAEQPAEESHAQEQHQERKNPQKARGHHEVDPHQAEQRDQEDFKEVGVALDALAWIPDNAVTGQEIPRIAERYERIIVIERSVGKKDPDCQSQGTCNRCDLQSTIRTLPGGSTRTACCLQHFSVRFRRPRNRASEAPQWDTGSSTAAGAPRLLQWPERGGHMMAPSPLRARPLLPDSR
jgi:hypothetical protein